MNTKVDTPVVNTGAVNVEADEVVRDFVSERENLLNLLIPDLKEFISSITIGDEIIQYLSKLPCGNKVMLKAVNSSVTFSEKKYLSNVLSKENFIVLFTQEEFLFVLIYLEKNKNSQKKFFVSISNDQNRVLWLDCSTKKIALYSTKTDIQTTPDMVFFYFSLFPQGIHKN